MTGSGALRRVAALMFLATILAAFLAFQASGDAPKGDPAAAKPIFNSKCIACHKVDGTGGVKLTGNPTPNWRDSKTWADPKRKDVDAYLRDCVTNGKIKSGMVAWGKTGQLKPQQIEDLIAYIKTTFKPK